MLAEPSMARTTSIGTVLFGPSPATVRVTVPKVGSPPRPQARSGR